MATNRRKRSRRTLGYPANIIATDESWSHACFVVDISETGARLLTRQPVERPEEFVLALSEGVLRHCRVIWMRDCEIGVAFGRPSAATKRAQSASIVPDETAAQQDQAQPATELDGAVS